MILASIDHVVFRYGARPIVDASWEIHQHSKIGLVAGNGAGRSTLLKLIAGEMKPDEGSISRAKGTRTGHLAQEPLL